MVVSEWIQAWKGLVKTSTEALEWEATLMAFFQEPSPTLNEFIHSWHPANIVPTNIEDLMYFNIKGVMLTGPWVVRTAYLMRGGMAFADAGYLASQNSLSIYRWMTKPSRTLASLTRIGATPIAVSLFGRHVLDEYGSAEFSSPGSADRGRLTAANQLSASLSSTLGQIVGQLNPFR